MQNSDIYKNRTMAVIIVLVRVELRKLRMLGIMRHAVPYLQ